VNHAIAPQTDVPHGETHACSGRGDRGAQTTTLITNAISIQRFSWQAV